MASRPVR